MLYKILIQLPRMKAMKKKKLDNNIDDMSM